MLIAIIGENCSGKSTLAQKMKTLLAAEVLSGRDYLRLAKSEGEAQRLFREKLHAALTEGNLVWVISEPEQVKLLPEGAVTILVQADLETIKERFKARMHGNLPAPVCAMLERKHGQFDSGTYDYRFDGVNGDAVALCEQLKEQIDASD